MNEEDSTGFYMYVILLRAACCTLGELRNILTLVYITLPKIAFRFQLTKMSRRLEKLNFILSGFMHCLQKTNVVILGLLLINLTGQ